MTPWSFLSHQALILVAIARDPHSRVREVAQAVGLTERATHRLVSELVVAGYLSRQRAGRRLVYHVEQTRPLRHPLEQQRTVGELLQWVDAPPAPRQ